MKRRPKPKAVAASAVVGGAAAALVGLFLLAGLPWVLIVGGVAAVVLGLLWEVS